MRQFSTRIWTRKIFQKCPKNRLKWIASGQKSSERQLNKSYYNGQRLGSQNTAPIFVNLSVQGLFALTPWVFGATALKICSKFRKNPQFLNNEFFYRFGRWGGGGGGGDQVRNRVFHTQNNGQAILFRALTPVETGHWDESQPLDVITDPSKIRTCGVQVHR